MVYFDDSSQERRFREAWESVEIVRQVSYSLFTFGESLLPYYLVCGSPPRRESVPVTISQGEVCVKRPMIITPECARPDLAGFFENEEEQGVAEFLLSRSAQFSRLKFDNHRGERRQVEDSVEGAVEKLNRKLDNEDEDRVAILTAPPQLAGVAILRYTAERVWESAPENIQELRERGFLP